MSVHGVSMPAVVIFGGGILFTWSAVKGAKVTSAARSVLQGQQPATGQVPVTAPSGGLSGPGSSTAPQAPVNVSGNVATGKLMAAAYGWGSGSNWNSLYALWTRESGWNNRAKNPSSGAYGIAQALPESKYPFAGQEAGGSHASAQIAWGLKYIKGRYGSPNAAWAWEESHGWY